MSFYRTAYSTAVLLCISIKVSFSGAWLQPVGKIQIINQIFVTKFNPKNPDGGVDKVVVHGSQYSLYSEYGLTQRNTIGFNGFLSHYALRDRISTGLNFVELFWRTLVFENRHITIATQGLIKCPGLYDGNDQNVRVFGVKRQVDYEGRLQIGLGMPKDAGFLGLLYSIGNFINLELGYRIREHLPFNEIKMDLIYGIRLNPRYVIMLSFFKILQIYKDSSVYPYFNNYRTGIHWHRNDISRLMISILIQVGTNSAISVGSFRDVKGYIFGKNDVGQNTSGINIGWWISI